jgi:ABC-2 type transport system permease protein
MPLFFASNALYPIEVMPDVIKYISLANPLTYTVSALRKLLVSSSYDVLQETLILTCFTALSLGVAIKSLRRIIE